MAFRVFLLILACTGFSVPAQAQVNWEEECSEIRVYDENTGSYSYKGARGKYFCIQEKPEEPKEPIAKKPPAQEKSQEEEEEKNCEDPESWDSSCGFVNPDNMKPEDAFAFQEKQRDTLLQNMSVRPDSMEAVVNAQKYMNWVIDKAMLLADMYEYSAVQNPELDPNAEYSGSSFAQKLIASRNLENKDMFWSSLKSWDAEVVLFTRASCDFCAQQASVIQRTLRKAQLSLVEVAIEDECVVSYATNCIRGQKAVTAAEKFGVDIVPTTMVFVPDEKTENPADGLWMRVSNGFSTGATISNRIYSYLNAWYSAAAQGVENAMDKPDFTGTKNMSSSEMKNHLQNVVGAQPTSSEEK